MTRNFKEWLSTFRPCISDYCYYVDFEKVNKNVDDIKVELNILNSLVGSKNIEEDFAHIIEKYPKPLNAFRYYWQCEQTKFLSQILTGNTTFLLIHATTTLKNTKCL